MSKTLDLRKIMLFLGLIAVLAVAIAAPSDAQRRARGIPVVGGLEDGGTFAGVIPFRTLTVAENAEGDGLVLRGVISGVARLADGSVRLVEEPFSTEIVSLTNGGSPTTCDILNLDLAPIHLDLLGLVVDLDEVHLDITGLTGEAKLLGNLLCGLLGIIEPPV